MLHMHVNGWRAILWLPPWVSPSPYCPAGGKEAKQVNVAQHCSHTQCRVNCIAMQGGESTQVIGALLYGMHERGYYCQTSPKYYAWDGNGSMWVTKIFFPATDREIHKSRLHPISPGCTSMIGNCHKCEQRIG